MTRRRSPPRPLGPSVGVAIPFPHDVDVAPELLVVALARAALLALLRALDNAHPPLAAPPAGRRLNRTERLARSAKSTALVLLDVLADYSAATQLSHQAGDAQDWPF